MSQTPTLLLLLKALEGRGAERMVTTLACAFADQNYQVHVLCLEDAKEMALDPRVHYHVVSYNDPELSTEAAQAQAYQKVANRIDHYVLTNIGSPDLILANIYKLNWIMSYSKLPNIINVLHTALSEQFKGWLDYDRSECLAHLAQVYATHPCVCVSEGARLDLLNLVDNSKTATIYNPCDANKIISAAIHNKNDIKKFGLIENGFIIHVASFAAMKNHHDLIKAYSQSSKLLPLVLVGKGELETEIKQLTIDLNIGDQVYFLGYQANPYPLMASAAFLVLSSKFEGFGYVIVEAQALKTPVISTDCPFGPRELLPSSQIVPVGDIEKLTELLNKAMADPDSYQSPFNPNLQPKAVAYQYLNFAKTCFNSLMIASAADQLNKQLLATKI